MGRAIDICLSAHDLAAGMMSKGLAENGAWGIDSW